jgi:GntR family transcriptional repressor for pyruvate dehydrogenase complex
MNKEYDANGFILNEGKIADRFNVSRGTVREAVRSLEMRGYIKRVHGKGIQVVDNSETALTRSFADMLERGQWTDADVLIEMREAIEISACSLVIPRITDDEINKLEKLVKAMEEDTEMSDEYYKNDFSFHLNFVKATKNQLMTALVRAYTPLLFNQVMLTKTIPPVNEELHYHYHRNILEGVKARGLEQTQYAMRVHLAKTKKLLQNKLMSHEHGVLTGKDSDESVS